MWFSSFSAVQQLFPERSLFFPTRSGAVSLEILGDIVGDLAEIFIIDDAIFADDDV